MNKERIRQLRDTWRKEANKLEPKSAENTYLYQELSQLVDAILSNESESVNPTTHDPRDGRPWPPWGVPIRAWNDDDKLNQKRAISLGHGKCMSLTLGDVWPLDDCDHWEYLYPPLSEWPEWAESWCVAEYGTWFVSHDQLRVGDSTSVGLVLHIVFREKAEG